MLILKGKGRATIAALLAAVLMLSGCSGSKLAENFDEQTVKQVARDVVDHMNEARYATITDEMVRDDLKSILSEQVLAQAAEQILAGAGDFESFSSEAVAGTKDQKTSEDYATAILVTQYADKKVTYTISFNKQMKIVGFYMK